MKRKTRISPALRRKTRGNGREIENENPYCRQSHAQRAKHVGNKTMRAHEPWPLLSVSLCTAHPVPTPTTVAPSNPTTSVLWRMSASGGIGSKAKQEVSGLRLTESDVSIGTPESCLFQCLVTKQTRRGRFVSPACGYAPFNRASCKEYSRTDSSNIRASCDALSTFTLNRRFAL